MQNLLEYLIVQDVDWLQITIVLVSFLESLAIIGLILPGTVIMIGIGVLIGNGKINFYQAWIAGMIGCLLGDWVSFWIGWRFKDILHCLTFIKNNQALLNKTENALYQHSMFTILVGRFVGPTRSLVPMITGMLNLPIIKFIIPNIIGCFFWPLIYFLPGLITGATINISTSERSSNFILLLCSTILLFWLSFWLCWKLWKYHTKNNICFSKHFTYNHLMYLFITILCTAVIFLIILIHHPLLSVYIQILFNILNK